MKVEEARKLTLTSLELTPTFSQLTNRAFSEIREAALRGQFRIWIESVGCSMELAEELKSLGYHAEAYHHKVYCSWEKQ